MRLHRLLEDARSLLDLIDDGHEKLGGEYILDRQFVVSLVDGAVDLLGRMVFHARVLRPDDAGTLYAAYDDCKAAASRLVATSACDASQGEADWRLSPEFSALGETLQWLEGTAPPPGASPLGLLEATLDHAILGVASAARGAGTDRSLDAVGHGRAVCLELIDLGGSENGDGQPARNHPLSLILRGVEEGRPSSRPPGPDRPSRYRVMLGEDRLDLIGFNRRPRLFVEAVVTGDPSTDFLFLWSRMPNDLLTIADVDPGLRLARSGRMAWHYDVPTADLEAGLVRLAGTLLTGG